MENYSLRRKFLECVRKVDLESEYVPELEQDAQRKYEHTWLTDGQQVADNKSLDVDANNPAQLGLALRKVLPYAFEERMRWSMQRKASGVQDEGWLEYVNALSTFNARFLTSSQPPEVRQLGFADCLHTSTASHGKRIKQVTTDEEFVDITGLAVSSCTGYALAVKNKEDSANRSGDLYCAELGAFMQGGSGAWQESGVHLKNVSSCAALSIVKGGAKVEMLVVLKQSSVMQVYVKSDKLDEDANALMQLVEEINIGAYLSDFAGAEMYLLAHGDRVLIVCETYGFVVCKIEVDHTTKQIAVVILGVLDVLTLESNESSEENQQQVTRLTAAALHNSYVMYCLDNGVLRRGAFEKGETPKPAPLHGPSIFRKFNNPANGEEVQLPLGTNFHFALMREESYFLSGETASVFYDERDENGLQSSTCVAMNYAQIIAGCTFGDVFFGRDVTGTLHIKHVSAGCDAHTFQEQLMVKQSDFEAKQWAMRQTMTTFDTSFISLQTNGDVYVYHQTASAPSEDRMQD